MTTELISRARAGDHNAFAVLTEPHRRELRVHCYRMLGSYQDAEDVLQETFISAWKGLAGFDARASLRTWLYRIATNHCLNARRTASRRPAKEWNIPGVVHAEPTRLGEVVWLEPFPDSMFDAVGPEARYAQRESISLAFITALQALPPRQVAVLVLRDVLGFPANEVADIMETTVESVNSALKRARENLKLRREVEAPSPADDRFVAQFVKAYEAADLDAVISMLTDDVFMSMPPMPFEYEGRDRVFEFCGNIFRAGRRFELAATRANGSLAFGTYLRVDDGPRRGVGLIALAFNQGKICEMIRFEGHVLPWFGLPASL